MREIDNIVVDYITNQHSYGIDTEMLINLFSNDSYRLHTSYPYQARVVNVNPINRNHDESIDRSYLLFQQLSWMTTCRADDWIVHEHYTNSASESSIQLQRNISELQFKEAAHNVSDLKNRFDSFRKNIVNLFEANINISLAELQSLVEICSQDSCSVEDLEKKVNSFERLFSGYNGYSTAYFCFFKSK